MSCGFPLTQSREREKSNPRVADQWTLVGDRAGDRSGIIALKLIMEALENVTSSCRWIVAQMKLNVFLETRKFSFHHMFNALEWNKPILRSRKNPCYTFGPLLFSARKNSQELTKCGSSSLLNPSRNQALQ